MRFARVLTLAGWVAAVFFVVTGGHLHAGMLLAIGLTLLLGFVEPLAAR